MNFEHMRYIQHIICQNLIWNLQIYRLYSVTTNSFPGKCVDSFIIGACIEKGKGFWFARLNKINVVLVLVGVLSLTKLCGVLSLTKLCGVLSLRKLCGVLSLRKPCQVLSLRKLCGGLSLRKPCQVLSPWKHCRVLSIGNLSWNQCALFLLSKFWYLSIRCRLPVFNHFFCMLDDYLKALVMYVKILMVPYYMIIFHET